MHIFTGQLPASGNYKKGRSSDIRFIVIHYTANKGDTAQNNVRYFAGNTVGTSAHFFVDDKLVYTSVPTDDTAYHCGGKLQGSDGHKYYGICTNSNSIGVEMCLWDKNGNVREGTVSNCVKLVRHLMETYGIDASRVIRHFDVTGKICPKPMVDDSEMWQSFKSRLKVNYDMDEINRINSVLTLIGKDIQELSERISAVERENNRQNEIINLVGTDIENLKRGKDMIG